jgi:murein DD-endopeptidase MepM/ murein hydrolase activator NlpD
MNTPRFIATAAFGFSFCSLLAVLISRSQNPTSDAEPTEAAAATVENVMVVAPPEPEPGPTWEHHTIVSGDTLGSILPRFSVSTVDVREAAMEIHDLAKLRVGRQLSFQYAPGEASPSEVRYPLDEDRTLVVSHDGAAWAAVVDAIEYDVRTGTRSLEVTSSLWEASINAGLRARDIVSLARVLEYDLDFNTEIRAGATAELLIEELWNDGEFARLGSPLALRFTNAEKEYTAIRFENSDGEVRYYDADGVSRKAAFLRSPLEFSRVTSGFNLKRYHPVLKKRRPHYGTDFGAPTGTPIRAVGDGVIKTAGWNGGHGRYIKIDHNGPYASSYSHLSKLAVSNGERVTQGQVIGYVGSTGMSTGPHLHYQFWVNGQIVDPMTVDLPRGDQLSGENLARFKTLRSEWLSVLGEDSEEAPEEPLADATE